MDNRRPRVSMPYVRDLSAYGKNYLSIEYNTPEESARLEMLRQIILEHSPGSILDIGCGPRPSLFLKDFSGQYLGLEPSLPLFEEAKAITTDSIQVVNETLEEFVSTREPFRCDLCLVSGLLHEVDMPERFLNTLREKIQAKFFYFSVPSSASLHRQLGNFLPQDNGDTKCRQETLQQNGPLSPVEFKKLVCDSNFTILRDGGYFAKLFPSSVNRHLRENGILTEDLFDALFQLGQSQPELSSEIYVIAKPNV